VAKDPLAFIKTVREGFAAASFIYTNGACFQFYKMLKHLFPQAVPWMDRDYHVITEIDGVWYDINGVATSEPHTLMCEWWQERAKTWSTPSVRVESF